MDLLIYRIVNEYFDDKKIRNEELKTNNLGELRVKKSRKVSDILFVESYIIR